MAQTATDFIFRGPPQGNTFDVRLSPGTTTTFVISSFSLENHATDGQSAQFSISAAVPDGWTADVSDPIITVANGDSRSGITVRVSIPPRTPATVQDIVVTATKLSGSNAGGSANVFIRLNLQLVNGTPTQTPALAPGCPEQNDPGDDFSHARLVRVNLPEAHGICSVGDEDWFKFAGVANKIYTIDVPQMDDGLDLSLELYGDREDLLTSNDDFPIRDGTPVPNDTRPRIQSWRAPRSGLFFVRVRDTLGVGGANLGYQFVVRGESYGPTPTTIAEICNDQYEQDGLPEIAKLITTNETQRRRLLCPEGDADWVKFFAITGRTYIISTDTRPYALDPTKPEENPEPGADTTLFLTSRDGSTAIDFNNDIAGANTLDSEIEFRPSVDGFYFAQVKNVGSIGNMFIKYDLTVRACPGLPCPRRTPVAAQAAAQAAAPAANPQPTAAPFVVQGTAPTPTPTVSRAAAEPAEAFQRVWQREDEPVVSGRVARDLIWGPAQRAARQERYDQAAGALRQVQYFDKGRMELNAPDADPHDPWYVNSGRLVAELSSGRVQVGDAEFTQLAPAEIPVVGELDDQHAPTYAGLRAALASSSDDRTGALPQESLDRSGDLGSYRGASPEETRLAQFIPQTRHNIPAVFWSYMNGSAVVYEDGADRAGPLMRWVQTLGYPLSEPYWVRATVDGAERDVLIQAFERRILSYVPQSPPGLAVRLSDTGRHYYLWRYGEELPQ